MILHNLVINGQAGIKHIYINNGIIQRITENKAELDNLNNTLRIELNGLSAFPGFINSHDHLDFNLFPQLGNPFYNNYTEWGHDIHNRFTELIEAVQKVPKPLRVQWGLYKNLLNGFTTVVNHGEKLAADNRLVDLFQDCEAMHSPAFEKRWKLKLNNFLRRKKMVVMHIGEGTDKLSENEVTDVLNWNFFHRKIIAIHGVAMKDDHADGFAGLVWCPASNIFLLNKTASVDRLMEKTTVVFGTDSTLTAPWQVRHHFKLALDTVNSSELLDMLTILPAKLWSFSDRGMIAEGKKADMIFASSFENICNEKGQQIMLIIKDGEIKLISSDIFRTVPLMLEDYDEIVFLNRNMMVKAGLKKLVTEIRSYYPEATIPFEISGE